jgi:hypothetical protein
MTVTLSDKTEFVLSLKNDEVVTEISNSIVRVKLRHAGPCLEMRGEDATACGTQVFHAGYYYIQLR